MEKLSLGIFVVPIVALSLVTLGYFYFAKQEVGKRDFNGLMIAVAITAFILNFIWEIVHGPLYQGFDYDWQHISFCGLASVADMLMVLILLFGFGLVYKNVFWIRNMGQNKVLLLGVVGFLGAILAEVWHTIRGDWSYADTMPLIPVIDVGVSPILQFTVLPWLIFLIGQKIFKGKVK